MRILITTGLSGTDTGGPAQYAPNLTKEFTAMGHMVKTASYGRAERVLPPGLRHAYFLIKILPNVIWANSVITLDTFSVGIPSILAARLFGRKVVVRIGGDFLWESYVERTGNEITLKRFNSHIPQLGLKEKLVLYFTKILIHSADKLAFNTEWQREIWQETYAIPLAKSCVVRNYIPEKRAGASTGNYFLWAGRKIKLKNIKLLKELSKEFAIEIVSGLPYLELQEKIKNCYAVILPSFSEVCPNFILEAVSYGKPFIMTRETGLKEIYNKGGSFIDPFDKKALKEAILEMLDTRKCEQYKNALVSMQSSRPWKTVAEEFLSICQ